MARIDEMTCTATVWWRTAVDSSSAFVVVTGMDRRIATAVEAFRLLRDGIHLLTPRLGRRTDTTR
jgi:hypothetical protein